MVAMDLGEYERGEEKMDMGSNHNPCVVSMGEFHHFGKKRT